MKRLDDFATKKEAIDYIIWEKKLSRQQAEKYLTQHLPKESYYQTKIIKYLKTEYPLAFVWKAAAGPYSQQGIPDVCAIIDGRFYGFEVKRPFIGRATYIQKDAIRRIKKAGGAADIVTGVEDVKRIIKEG